MRDTAWTSDTDRQIHLQHVVRALLAADYKVQANLKYVEQLQSELRCCVADAPAFVELGAAWKAAYLDVMRTALFYGLSTGWQARDDLGDVGQVARRLLSWPDAGGEAPISD